MSDKNKAMRTDGLLSYTGDKSEGAKKYVEVLNGSIFLQHEGNRGMTYSTEYVQWKLHYSVQVRTAEVTNGPTSYLQ